MREERVKFLKRLEGKDREYFQENEHSLRHCEKVWDIPMTYSHTEIKDRGDTTVHELKAVQFIYKNPEEMTSQEKFEAAKREHLEFSNYNEDGEFVGDDMTNFDAHNTNRVFTKQSSYTRHKYKPMDK